MSLSLNCLVYGDDLEKWFTVEVQKDKNVSILKKLIKEEKAPHLDHIDASDLDLYLTLQPLHVNHDPSKKLSPRKILSSIFDQVIDPQRLHIIAKAPGTSH